MALRKLLILRRPPFETPPAAAPQDKAAVSRDAPKLNPGTRRFAQGCGVEDHSSFNPHGRFCCRFAAGAAIGNNRFNS